MTADCQQDQDACQKKAVFLPQHGNENGGTDHAQSRTRKVRKINGVGILLLKIIRYEGIACGKGEDENRGKEKKGAEKGEIQEGEEKGRHQEELDEKNPLPREPFHATGPNTSQGKSAKGVGHRHEGVHVVQDIKGCFKEYDLDEQEGKSGEEDFSMTFKGAYFFMQGVILFQKGSWQRKPGIQKIAIHKNG